MLLIDYAHRLVHAACRDYIAWSFSKYNVVD